MRPISTLAALAALAALAVFTPQAAFATCSDDADALAHKYGISAVMPQTTGASAEATSETLAKTGGVVAPPPTGYQATIAPPAPNIENMKTAPALTPQTAQGETAGSAPSSSAKIETNAATQSQAAALLQAARAAGVKGDDKACVQRLADAKALLEKSPQQSQ